MPASASATCTHVDGGSKCTRTQENYMYTQVVIQGCIYPPPLPALQSSYLDNRGNECSSVMTSVLHTLLQLLQVSINYSEVEGGGRVAGDS